MSDTDKTGDKFTGKRKDALGMLTRLINDSILSPSDPNSLAPGSGQTVVQPSGICIPERWRPFVDGWGVEFGLTRVVDYGGALAACGVYG